MADKSSVLFVCVHNADRSQMAGAWLTHPAGPAAGVTSCPTSCRPGASVTTR